MQSTKVYYCLVLNDFVWANNIDYVFCNTKLSGIKIIFGW